MSLVFNNTNFPTIIAERIKKLKVLYDISIWAQPLRFYQFLVKEIMTNGDLGVGDNPRGLLIYGGMGMGKTRLAASVIIDSKRECVVLLNNSLKENFTNTMNFLINTYGFEMPSYTYVSMDAYNSSEQMAKIKDKLDGKLLVIDEAHNFFRAIINSTEVTTNARKMYDMIMDAKNLRLLFLSGTPVAKSPFEVVPCFNMLAGYDLLPTQYEVFHSLYLEGTDILSIKNKPLLMNRLFGMVSHVSHNLPTEPQIENLVDDTFVSSNFKVIEARSDGWYPEELPTIFKKLEMSDEQYKAYLIARENEIVEAANKGAKMQRNKVFSSGPLSLPGASKASSTYHVYTRMIGNYFNPTIDKKQFKTNILALADSNFTEINSPKCVDMVNVIKSSPGPVLVYSQFVENGLNALERYLILDGYEEFKVAHEKPNFEQLVEPKLTIEMNSRRVILNSHNIHEMASKEMAFEQLKSQEKIFNYIKHGYLSDEIKYITGLFNDASLPFYEDKEYKLTPRENYFNPNINMFNARQTVFLGILYLCTEILKKAKDNVNILIDYHGLERDITRFFPGCKIYTNAKTKEPIDIIFLLDSTNIYNIIKSKKPKIAAFAIDNIVYNGAIMMFPWSNEMFNVTREHLPCEIDMDNVHRWHYEQKLSKIWKTYEHEFHAENYDRCTDCMMEYIIMKNFADKFKIPNPLHKLIQIPGHDKHGLFAGKSMAERIYIFSKTKLFKSRTGGAIKDSSDEFFNQPRISSFHKLDNASAAINDLSEIMLKYYNTEEIEYILSLDNKIYPKYDPTEPIKIHYRPDREVEICGVGVSISNIMTLHHGQRKLTFTEIQCLTKLLDTHTQQAIIVYAGAAACTHLPVLINMFPNCKWHLYDLNDFDPALSAFSNIKIYKQFFKEKDAEYWFRIGCDIFISDIRLDVREEQIAQEMKEQMDWVRTIRPHIGSMLKYKPPYDKLDKFQYLAGDIYRQVRSPSHSIEARLISTRDQIEGSLIMHDPKHFEDSYYQYNIRRLWSTIESEKYLTAIRGYDRCLDCATEVHILQEYIDKFKCSDIITLLTMIQQITKQKLQSVVKSAGDRVTTKTGYNFHGINADETAPIRIRKAIDLFCNMGIKSASYGGDGDESEDIDSDDIDKALIQDISETIKLENTLRYAEISGAKSKEERELIQNVFNADNNAHGEKIKVLLISETGAEGLDLKNIRTVIIMEPYWDEARLAQVKSRAIRQGSHDALPLNEREVQTYIYMACHNKKIWDGLPKKEDQTIDEQLFDKAMKNYKIIKDFRDMLVEVSLECNAFGYGKCMSCGLTNQPLISKNALLDSTKPNPCVCETKKEVKANKLTYNNVDYYYEPDAESISGYTFYTFNSDFGSYVKYEGKLVLELAKLIIKD